MVEMEKRYRGALSCSPLQGDSNQPCAFVLRGAALTEHCQPTLGYVGKYMNDALCRYLIRGVVGCLHGSHETSACGRVLGEVVGRPRRYDS